MDCIIQQTARRKVLHSLAHTVLECSPTAAGQTHRWRLPGFRTMARRTTNAVWPHSCGILRIVKFTETEAVSVARSQGRRDRKWFFNKGSVSDWWYSLISVPGFNFWLLAFFLCCWYNFRSINIALKMFLCYNGGVPQVQMSPRPSPAHLPPASPHPRVIHRNHDFSYPRWAWWLSTWQTPESLRWSPGHICEGVLNWVNWAEKGHPEFRQYHSIELGFWTQ